VKLSIIKRVLKLFRAHRSIPNTGDKRKMDRTTAHTEKCDIFTDCGRE
jgi:hypothetical protein